MKRGKNWVNGLPRLCDSWVKMGFELSLSLSYLFLSEFLLNLKWKPVANILVEQFAFQNCSLIDFSKKKTQNI